MITARRTALPVFDGLKTVLILIILMIAAAAVIFGLNSMVEGSKVDRMLIEAGAVSRDVRQSQLVHAPVDPLFDLSAHLAEARPAHSQPGEGPLQEIHALAVFHSSISRNVSAL